MTTPTLLRKMNEIPVGELIVYGDRIIEPRTGCWIACGFPNKAKAIAAANEMNEVADWIGVIKTRAEGGRPNCQDELKRIAEAHGGRLSDNAKDFDTEARCAAAVAKIEKAY
jgi:hypothetical protein